MRTVYKSLLSIVLVISMLLCATVPAFAAGAETYISELRLIYAEDYEEALEILEESEFSDYKLYKKNLNEGTGEIGVFLAYKTTTDIEDAITDIAVIQMNGGYKDGNFQEMIQKSYEEYVAIGKIYKEALAYFAGAYDAGDFLAEMAYRQLNFYTVETQEGIGLEVPDFEGEHLGDIFYDGISANELATMFLEGNSYALKNIRSLISMGVSYNSDGKTYLKKVAESAAKMNTNSNVFDGKGYDEIASAIDLAIPSISDLLKELALYEDDFDFTDGKFTAEELHYLEIKAIADTMRETPYLGEQTLYDFFIKYIHNEEGNEALYPLVDALNDGQVAMTKVSHYYDVIRYSAALVDEEILNEELEKMEETYLDNPFNIYTGVDRSIYYGTFALTTEADRADAYSEVDMMTSFLGTDYRATSLAISLTTGTCGLFMLGLGAMSRYIDNFDYRSVLTAYNDSVQSAGEAIGSNLTNMPVPDLSVASYFTGEMNTNETVFDALYHMVTGSSPDAAMSFADKVDFIANYNAANGNRFGEFWTEYVHKTQNEIWAAKSSVSEVSATAPVSFATGLFFVFGGALTIYSAYKLGMTVYNYYHPDYEDIPVAMVDLIKTVDGDRYIKYDAVFNAEINDDGVYEAADLNAFQAKAWNALYYTKSYEAGKPLLANSFILSNTSNKPKEGYAPVHRFGEVVCYNLNKYNFSEKTTIYLSVKQSKNNKAAVADVPEVVGSMFGTGFLFLAGGVGVVFGIGGMLATNEILKKKKSKATDPANTSADE